MDARRIHGARQQLIMLGLSYTNADALHNSINNRWSTYTNGRTHIYELGTQAGTYAMYAVGDVLRTERRCDSIVYYHNGVWKRSVLDPQPQTPMIVDFSIYDNGRSVYGLKVHNNANYKAVAVMKSDYYPFGMQC